MSLVSILSLPSGGNSGSGGANPPAASPDDPAAEAEESGTTSSDTTSGTGSGSNATSTSSNAKTDTGKAGPSAAAAGPDNGASAKRKTVTYSEDDSRQIAATARENLFLSSLTGKAKLFDNAEADNLLVLFDRPGSGLDQAAPERNDNIDALMLELSRIVELRYSGGEAVDRSV